MSKFERRVWFERLVELRTAYRELPQPAAVMTVDEAIAWGEHLLADPTALEAVLVDDTSAGEPTNRPAA